MSSKHISPKCLRSIWDFLAPHCGVICMFVALLKYLHISTPRSPFFFLWEGSSCAFSPTSMNSCLPGSHSVIHCPPLYWFFLINSPESSPPYRINKITSHLTLKFLWHSLAFPHWQTAKKVIYRPSLPFILCPLLSTQGCLLPTLNSIKEVLISSRKWF